VVYATAAHGVARVDGTHKVVRGAPASLGDAGREPQRAAGVPGTAREGDADPSPGSEDAATIGTGDDGQPAPAISKQRPPSRTLPSPTSPSPTSPSRAKKRPGKSRYASAPSYAAVDLGTNNCRLLVARPTRHGFKVIDAFSRIVRLGEGLGSHNELSPQAMDRAVGALRICAAKMRRGNVARARVIATQACRHALNADAFMDRVAYETGLELEVVTAEEEARLAVLGCIPLLDRSASRALVFDIGGGSTELVWLDTQAAGAGGQPRILAWASVPAGVVTLAERYDGRTIDRAGYECMVREVTSLLDQQRWPQELHAELAEAAQNNDIHLLGTSGTVTTIAGIHLGLRRYDRSKVDGVWIDFQDVAAVTQDLSSMSFAERVNVPCVGKDRADLVLAGCAILEAIQSSWPCRRLRVADRGLREGILLTLMREDRRSGKRKRRRRGGRQGRRHTAS